MYRNWTVAALGEIYFPHNPFSAPRAAVLLEDETLAAAEADS
jgi:hypothetical protein